MSETKTPSCHDYVLNLRQRLKDDGIIKSEADKFIFMENYIFNSPSTAAAVVLGRNSNGWIEWKNKEGKTLDELKRK